MHTTRSTLLALALLSAATIMSAPASARMKPMRVVTVKSEVTAAQLRMADRPLLVARYKTYIFGTASIYCAADGATIACALFTEGGDRVGYAGLLDEHGHEPWVKGVLLHGGDRVHLYRVVFPNAKDREKGSFEGFSKIARQPFSKVRKVGELKALYTHRGSRFDSPMFRAPGASKDRKSEKSKKSK